MNTGMLIKAILTLMAGIGVFLVACSTMSANLEAAGSEKLKSLFAKTQNNRLLGVGIGAIGTAAIQSSGATTVMVIGFVNVGILTLQQAAAIIFGANIGTTITGQIVALGMFGTGSISTTVLFSSLAGIGAFCIVFTKSPKWKTIGGILSGFGMLFIGLDIMSSSMTSFAKDEAVINFLARIENVFLLVLIGAVITAIVQSSSVMTSVAITMLVAGLISINQGIYLTMGSNIGSCIVALIAGLSGSANAKRTALIHLFFNTMGVLFF
ncbi:MAG: Na/Pi cotransporter family protein [Treponema sp.]|nr:Na/Pi cotransporter family protein [Treponema sp.]